ncbi:MAG TPA: glycogen debranching enzyme GlgX, partial [Nocardioides bacterium]|nr:glycogen debranching enzyme GlgX [Nocardioides sp.]
MPPGQWRSRDQTAAVWPGRNWPLGATWSEEATNFAVWAPEARAVHLCLIDDEGWETSHRLTERSLGIWHGAVPGVRPGTRYGYRVAGTWAPAMGLRFNSTKLLLDPFARAVSGDLAVDPSVFGYEQGAPELPNEVDSAPHVPLGVVVDDHFDWQGDVPIRRRWRDTVIYELHV